MIYEFELEKFYLTFDHEISQAPKELYMGVSMNRQVPLLIKMYNPKGLYIGQITYGLNNYIKAIHYTRTRATLNGRIHELLAGVYRLEVLFLGAENSLEDLKLAIEITSVCPENSELTPESYQEQVWFGESGLALDFDQVYKPVSGYFKGDFHGHSTFSDGHLSPREVVTQLDYNDLDFMALTEHNIIPFGFSEVKQMMIPSFELTLPRGHMNFHGLKQAELMTLELMNKFGESERINDLVEALMEGCNVSLNHMFMTPWAFTYGDLDLRNINSIEVICDPTYPTSACVNDKAVAFVDYLWQQGIKIYGIGGSDSHNKLDELYDGSLLPSVYGDPATYVFCEGLSINNILKGIKKGCSYVSRFFELDIEIGQGQLLPGMAIGETIPSSYKVSIRSEMDYVADKIYVGKLFCNGDVIREQEMSIRSNEFVFEGLEDIFNQWPKWASVRFGLYDMEGHVVAFVNPIYRGRQEANSYKLERLIEEFDRLYD